MARDDLFLRDGLKDAFGRRGKEDMDDSNPPASTLRTRPTLLFKIRTWEDGASWEEFHRLYRRLVYGRARRAGLAHADAEDVAQEVFKRVAETIKDFNFDAQKGSFRGWLMQLTQWRIADKFAARGKVGSSSAANAPLAPTATPAIEQVAAPVEEEDEWDREWQQHLLSAALERLARKVQPRHFQAFDLYVRQDWSVGRVAKELGMSSATVYVIGHRLTRMLRAEVKALEEQLG